MANSAVTGAQAPNSSPAAPGAVFEKPFSNIHSTAPFSQISNADFEPAIERGIELARKEIKAIADNPEPPTFENTIVALDRSGADLNRVLNIFYPLLSADADDELMAISMKVTPVLSDYSTSIVLNEKLWKRIKTVYDNRSSLTLTPEQKMLLEQSYESFAQSGATLEGDDREAYRRLSSQLSELTTLFGQNVLRA